MVGEEVVMTVDDAEEVVLVDVGVLDVVEDDVVEEDVEDEVVEVLVGVEATGVGRRFEEVATV